jgi:hypothetical protein
MVWQRWSRLPFQIDTEKSAIVSGLLNHDLIGVNPGWLPGADVPGRHAKHTFSVDFDVTGFDSRSEIGAE